MFADIATHVSSSTNGESLAHLISAVFTMLVGFAAIVASNAKTAKKTVRKPTHRSMTLKQWMAVPDAPIQRNTEKHAASAKTRKNLGTLCPAHLTVHMAMLPDGSCYKVDGHTRCFMWANGLTDQVPESIDVVVHQVDDIEGVLDLYNSYDDSGQVKQAADQLYSAFKQFDIPTTSKFFQNAAGIVSGLKEAYREVCRAYGLEHEGDARAVSVTTVVEFFRSQLIALDALQPRTSKKGGPNFKGPVTTAFLLAHYKYSELGKHVQEVLSFFHAYNNDLGVKNGKNFDPVFSVSKTMSGSGAGEQLRLKRAAEILGAIERWLQPQGREAKYSRQSEVELENYLVDRNARKTSRAQRARHAENKKNITR